MPPLEFVNSRISEKELRKSEEMFKNSFCNTLNGILEPDILESFRRTKTITDFNERVGFWFTTSPDGKEMAKAIWNLTEKGE